MGYFWNISIFPNAFLALKSWPIDTYPEDSLTEQLLNCEEECRSPHAVPALVLVLLVRPVWTSGSTKVFHKSLQDFYNIIIMVVEQTDEPPRPILCLQQFPSVSVGGINYLQGKKSWNSLAMGAAF